MSVGVPTPGAVVRVVDGDGNELPPETAGELEFTAPQVVSGYWNKPEASASALPDGRLRTGDVAVLDPDGWVYLVDRLKDQINTSGYKVWPREVEDAFYEHPAVFEAGVRFARAEGILPAPEANHAVKAVIDEALRCREEGSSETILFNLCGHGHFDMQAYIDYFAGTLEDREYDEGELAMALAGLPAVAV